MINTSHLSPHFQIKYFVFSLFKGTSNCLAEFEKNNETASQIFLNFLYDLGGILPEIDTNLPLECHKHGGT